MHGTGMHHPAVERTEASQENCTALSSSLGTGPTKSSGICTSCSTTDCAPPAPTEWVLMETRVSPANYDSDFFNTGRFEGSHLIYSETRNSVTHQHRDVDKGFENYNVTVTCNFPTPPSNLFPGENVLLSVSFTASGTVVNGNPGAQFQYWVDGSSIDPPFSYFYVPWSPNFSGENSTTYKFNVENVCSGGELDIVAFW